MLVCCMFNPRLLYEKQRFCVYHKLVQVFIISHVPCMCACVWACAHVCVNLCANIYIYIHTCMYVFGKIQCKFPYIIYHISLFLCKIFRYVYLPVNDYFTSDEFVFEMSMHILLFSADNCSTYIILCLYLDLFMYLNLAPMFHGLFGDCVTVYCQYF